MQAFFSLILTVLFLVLQVGPSDSEIWLRYPVSSRGLGEGGQFDSDLTYKPAVPVALTFADDRSVILAGKNISTFLQDNPDVPEMIRLKRMASGEYRFIYGEPGQSGAVTVWLRENETGENILAGEERITYVMGEASKSFLIAPVGATDPRPDEGERCNGGPRIRLSIGERAATGMASGEMEFYERLDSPSSIRAYVNQVDVVAGPVCRGQVAWWQVSLHDDPNSVGWTPEMFPNGGYLLRPVRTAPALVEPVECEGAPATRLSAGAFATLEDGIEATSLHVTPGSDEILAQIPAEAFYRVLDGPVCEDSALWWVVEYAEYSGWVAEGHDDVYTLQPSHVVILSDHLREIQQSASG